MLGMVCLKAQTNVYHPMLSDTSVEWTFSYCNNQCYFHKVKICGTMTYTNNQTYYILCDYVFQGNGNPYTLLYNDTIALMREDTVNKKVYGRMMFYFGIDSIERLLYDFDSIYIGKPLNTYFHSVSGVPDTIKCLDSIQLLNGTYRVYFTHFYVGNNCGNPVTNSIIGSPGTVIAGIGNITNPFTYWEYIPCSNNPCPYSYLLCYKKNNIVLWQNTLYAPSDICNAVLSIKTSNISLTHVFPTIVNNYLNIETNINNPVFEIYTIQGELIKKLNLRANANQVDVSDLSNGVYFIKVCNLYYSTWHKIIINH